MNTTARGQKAEAVVARFLDEQGYQIIDRNWRTRFCEIDIIAYASQVIFFVEVKYRVRGAQGDGLDSITSSKLEQMRFAAEIWVSRHLWQDGYQLAVASVSGTKFRVDSFITDL